MQIEEAKSILETDKQARLKQAEAEFQKVVAEIAVKYHCTIKPVILANVDENGITRYSSIVRFDAQ